MAYMKITELFTVCDATMRHALDILEDAREEDAVEWFKATGQNYSELVEEEINDRPKGSILRAVLLNETGKCIVLWGVKPVPRAVGMKSLRHGIGWMIATTDAPRWALPLHRLIPEEQAYVDETFSNVKCFADEDNHVHHQWLDWMGFDFKQHVVMGPFNSLFREYVREA